MIELKWIKTCIQHSNYYFSSHGDRERQNDNLLISDIETILLNGKSLRIMMIQGVEKVALL